jgi:hypothetical protein
MGIGLAFDRFGLGRLGLAGKLRLGAYAESGRAALASLPARLPGC